MKVILDTNFLIYCGKNKVDYVEEIGRIVNDGFNLVVPKQVMEELKVVSEKEKSKIPFQRRKARFMKTTGKDKRAALLAISIIEKYVDDGKIELVDLEGKNVDDAILELAGKDSKNIVATLDREMREKLGRVILIKKNGKLMLTR